MESLNLFFKEVSSMTIEYSQKGPCEFSSLYTKAKENGMQEEVVAKVKDCQTINEDYAISFLERLGASTNFFEEMLNVDIKDPLSICMLSDIPFSVENECISLLQNKLFSLSSNDRNIYAGLYAREFDSKLFCEFDLIVDIYANGYETYLLENSITAYMDAVIDTFAEFNIDLVEYLKKDSDFEKLFGDYNDFRAKKFANKLEDASLSTKENDSNAKRDVFSNYLSVDNKEEWLIRAHAIDNYQDLSDYLGIKTACGEIKKIPSKKGSGLFNLACVEFPDIFKYKNEKERCVLRNAVNNAVQKHRDYSDVYPHK